MTTKKLATIAAALLISVAQAAAIINQPVHTVQAATQSQKGKVTLKKSFNGTVQVFNSKGNATTTTQKVNGKKMTVASTVKSGSSFKYYGKPILIQGKKVDAKTSKNYHYTTASYVNIGKKRYIKSLNVSSMDGQNVLILSSNSRIYDKNGHRTTFNGLSLIPKYMLVKTPAKNHATTKNDVFYYFSNLSGSKKRSLNTTTIKGKPFYALGNGAYIYASNVGFVNGNTLYQASGTTTATILNKIHVLNNKLKSTSKLLKIGQKVKVDATKTTGEGDEAGLYFRIAGTKGKNAQYIYWGDDAEYGMDQESTTDEFQGNFNLDNHLAN